jgi:DNA primase
VKSIPQDFIEEVISRTDLVTLIDPFVPLKRNGKNYTACCPFHDEKTPSFTVSPEKQFYYCFGCGANGNAISFLMDQQRLGFQESVTQLAQRAGLPMPDASAEDTQRYQTAKKLSALLGKAAEFFADQLKTPAAASARQYLHNRGITPQSVQAFQLGWAPNQWTHFCGTHAQADHPLLIQAGLAIEKDKGGIYERFRGRLMFPIRDHRGQVIGFGGRVLDDSKPKYLNSPETPVFHKQKALYGWHEWLNTRPLPTSAILVEGYTDVISLHQAGLTQALATLGTACSEHHLNLLFQRTDTLYFCFDGDAAGQKAALRALNTALPQLRDGRQIFFLMLPEGDDPDSLVKNKGPGAFLAALEHAHPLSEYLLEHLTEGKTIQKVDERAALVEKAKPFFARLPKGLYQTLLLDALAERAGIKQIVLEEALQNAVISEPAPGAQSLTPHHQAYAQPQQRNTGRPLHQTPQAWADGNAYPSTHATKNQAQPTTQLQGVHNGTYDPFDALKPTSSHWPGSHKGGKWSKKNQHWHGKSNGQRYGNKPWEKPAAPPMPTAHLSLVETMLSCLLQKPEIGRTIALSDRVRQAPLPDIELLNLLLQEINSEQDCSLAYLLGRWHNSVIGEKLAKLAARPLLVSTEMLRQEFIDALFTLEMTALERQIDEALTQANPDPAQLKALLSEKSSLANIISEKRAQATEG